MSEDACGALCFAVLGACFAGICQDFISLRHACVERTVADPQWYSRDDTDEDDDDSPSATPSIAGERAPLLGRTQTTQPVHEPPMVVAPPDMAGSS